MIESSWTRRLEALEFGSKEKLVKWEKLSELREQGYYKKERKER